jgi:hypothetical protein
MGKNNNPTGKGGLKERPQDRGRKTKLPEDVKRARKLNQAEFQLSVNKIISLRRSELEKLVASPDSNVLEQLVATIWLRGIKDSSKAELNYFVERFLGKVPENHNFSGNFHAGIVDYLSQLNSPTKGITNGQQEESFEDDEE